MSNSPADDERLDHDQTDELPVLLDTADLEGDEDVSASTAERTGEHTAHLTALPNSDDAPADVVERELDQRIKQIAALERDLARLSTRWLDTERYLTEKDAVIRDLNRALAKTRVELAERRTTEQRLAAELADRESQFAELLEELDRLREAAAGRDREIERERTARQAAVEELAVARLELAQRASPISEDEEIRALREELATLSVYIDNRHASWVASEGRATAQQQRIVELERELAHRAGRQQRAETLAERENSRALALREQLVEQSRQTESLAAELAQYRSYPDAQRAAIAGLEAELAAAWQAHERLQQELAAARERAAQVARDQKHGSDLPAKRTHAGAAERIATAPDREPQRQSVQELEPQLAAGVAQGETAQRPDAEARAALDEARAGTARTERTMIQKDRVLAVPHERIATPQAELDQHDVEPVHGQTDTTLRRPDSKVLEPRRRADTPADHSNTPLLVCLTSDAPGHYALTKRVTTIGRSSQCDIQIVTHFVSREHARISIAERGGVTIEDLASTNGVFVNSLRVERQELRHGDLVTVGETQFRFLESMAH
jgi:FHA domain